MTNSVSQPIKKQDTHSLVRQVREAQVWLPLAIVVVVLLHQLWVVPIGGEHWQFWSQLLFYGLVGPVVTYMTLRWIRQQAEARDRDRASLEYLYHKLQGSHALLSAIQGVTEQFASAEDFESVLDVAAQGITEVTAAAGSAIIIRSGEVDAERFFGLDNTLCADARARNQRLNPSSQHLPLKHNNSAAGYYVLTYPLRWGGRLEGSLYSYFPSPPSSEQRESFAILVSEFSSAAEAARGRIRDMLTLVQVDRTIRAEGNLETLLATLLEQVMQRVDAHIGAVYLLDANDAVTTRTHLADELSPHEAVTAQAKPTTQETPGILHLRAYRCLESSEPPVALTMPVARGIIGRVAKLAQAEIIPTLENHEHTHEGSILAGMGSVIALPLQNEVECLGVVVLAHPQAAHFHRSSLPFLTLLAGQVSLAVRNAQAYLQSEQLAIAEERARIAREIHDGVAQSLAFSALKLDLVSRTIHDTQATENILTEVKGTLRETIRELRRSIFALRPVDLERYGLVETIRRYVVDFGEQNGMAVQLHISEAMPSLSAQSEAVVYRIFQEAMHNVAKHAKATHVWVRLEPCDAPNSEARGAFCLTVEDDGVGFDPQAISDKVTSAGGLGLRQMQERLAARGGALELQAAPQQGTRLTALLPRY